MKTFKRFVTEKTQSKSPTQLKVGDRVLDGPEDDPHEITSKAQQDGTGYWVKAKNLKTGKATKIYIDSGDKIRMDV